MGNLFNAVFLHGRTERHQKAYSSWLPLWEEGMVGVVIGDLPRNAKEIGDERDLVYMKDVLGIAHSTMDNKDDVLIWHNDDVILDPNVARWAMKDVADNGAMTMRRFEPENPDSVHMGRELFGFTKEWLDKHLEMLPDFLLGCPFFDLVVASYIRKLNGLKSTVENMSVDYPLCEATERYAIHHAHQSSWAGIKEHTFPGNKHNRKLAREWCERHMPTLKL